MLQPGYLRDVSDGAVEIASEMERRIINRIVRAIVTRARRGDDYILTARDKWLIDTMQESGVLLNDITKIIAQYTGLTNAEISRAMVQAGVKTLTWDEEKYIRAGLDYDGADIATQKAVNGANNGETSITPRNGESLRDAAARRARKAMRESPYIRRLVERDYNVTAGSFHNETMSMAYAGVNAFVEAVDTAYERATRGEVGYSSAIMDAVQELADKGIRLQNRAGRTEELETAVARCVRTGVAKMAADITVERATEMGVDHFIVSSHIGARYGDKGNNPSNHYWWQGKVYQWVGLIEGAERSEYPDFIECTGYGSIEGLCGINCRHSFGPWIEGMNNNHTEYDESANEERYDTDQKCRGMERNIRHLKRSAQTLQSAIDNMPDGPEKDQLRERLGVVNGKITDKGKEYRAFCKENNLRPLTERLQVASNIPHFNFTTNLQTGQRKKEKKNIRM